MFLSICYNYNIHNIIVNHDYILIAYSNIVHDYQIITDLPEFIEIFSCKHYNDK